jgi:TolB protein
VDGGFDPVTIPGSVGDTLVVDITRTGAAAPIHGWEMVKANRPPVVVRTEPPPQRVDVPLNSIMVVVFSEPIDSATLNTGSVQLRRDTTPVGGTVRFSDATGLRVEFHPDSLLAGQTEYRLVVTQTIHGVNGVALASPVVVAFTTGISAVASVTIAPTADTLVVGTTSSLTATTRDAAGHALTGRVVTWTSSDTTKAKVTAAGLVTGVAVGSATITATSGGKSGTAALTLIPAAAPRTGRIAFISNSCDNHDNCLDDIYVVNADGSNAIRLTTASGGYARPVWSPNGAQVASGDYVVNADGSNPYWLPGGDGNGPAWSPSGSQIAFRNPNSGQIYVINADGTNPTPLCGGGCISPAWLPDGTKIAFSSSGQIYVMNADGTNSTRLTNVADTSAWRPVWSPTGAKLAFSEYESGQIYVMNADGTNLIRLFNPTHGHDGEPTLWSPDGAKIVFTYSAHVYIVNVDGTNLIRLETNDLPGVEAPTWSPDGTRILFTTATIWGSAYVVNADGSNLHRLSTGYGGAAWSPDGRAIAVGATYGPSGPTISVMNDDGTRLAEVIPCNCSAYPGDPISYGPAWRPR